MQNLRNGVLGKVSGIVDLESKKEVKKEINMVKAEMDMKECELRKREERVHKAV